jgi:hypothetical protein
MTALLVAGCSAAAPPSPTPTPQPTPTPAPSYTAVDPTSQLPAGKYEANITQSGLEAPPGVWKMDLSKDGIVWHNPYNGSVFSPGVIIEVTSSTIVFAPDPECPGQGGAPGTGTYDWKLDQGQLKFTVVSESCLGRRDTLITAPWTPAA